jgi:dTDP-glucose 4,6-dehydratase
MGVGPELVKPVPDRPGHDRRYALDCTKLKKLGFRHSVDFDQALKLTIGWYRLRRDWWEPVKGREDFKAYYKRQYKALHK